MDPYEFEQLVVDLLFVMGYGGSREEAATVTQKSNDGGIDGIINEDRLGLDVIYIQTKRHQATIGRVDSPRTFVPCANPSMIHYRKSRTASPHSLFE